MSHAIVFLVMCVALGQGGLSPWATLVLELGAIFLALWAVIRVIWGTSAEEKRYFLEQRRLQNSVPFLRRHRVAGALVGRLSPRKSSRDRTRSEVEVLPPRSIGRVSERWSSRLGEYWILWGYPFKRTGLGIPLVLLTLWITLSLVPLHGGVLASISPQAHGLRVEVGSLLDDPSSTLAPWSLAPFLTLQSLWLWVAYVLLFYASVCVARDERNLEGLSRGLFVGGIVYGLYGIAQWLMGLQELFGTDPSTAGLRASASFGNRNHYAAFMEMFFLCGLGWLSSRWVGLFSTQSSRDARLRRRVNVLVHEAGAKLFVMALGVVVLASSLIFSLSRSGIAFGMVGCAVFALLVTRSAAPEGPRRHRRRWKASHLLLVLALFIIAITAWVGLDPVVHRFQLLPDEWEKEKGRWQVWVDSWGAVQDFSLTGAGLGSFRYVFPLYRTFGGVIYYSWAHNDYLQALVELGVPGMTLILGVMVLLWRSARRVRRGLEGQTRLLFQHAGYVAAAAAIAFHSFTDFGLHMPANAALFAVVVGVVVGLEGE